MTLRPTRIAVALLLGFILAACPVFAMFPPAATAAAWATHSCCCDCAHCKIAACCAKSNAPRAPVAPAPVPSSYQNEWQALAASLICLLTPLSPLATEHPSQFSAPAVFTAIPLFQQNCCFLI
jgi:hypothetical protein